MSKLPPLRLRSTDRINSTSDVTPATPGLASVSAAPTPVAKTSAADSFSVADQTPADRPRPESNGQGKNALTLRLPSSTTNHADPVAITETDLAAYASRNAKSVGKYPTLDLVLRDPDAFVADVKTRFAEAKKTSPANPYAFDFSDYGLPVLETVSKALDAEITKITGQLEKLQGNTSALQRVNGSKRKIDDRKLGLEYLRELKADVDTHLGGGQVSYRRLQELSYFSSRALGMLDISDLNLRDRSFLMIDRYIHGRHGIPIADEYALYLNNAFVVFEGESPVSGFKMVEKQFEEAFFNQSDLELISLPTTEDLGIEPFMRLSSYDVFLMGIAPEPAAADGFVRPGADFWAHDFRHSSSIFGKRKVYECEHRMTEPQTRKLQKQIDVWRADLDQARKQIPDKDVRIAVSFFMFNYHHDRGLPMVPSSYLPEASDTVPRLLHMMLTASKQSPPFGNPKATLDKAYAWLREFYLERLPEEQAILGDFDLSNYRSLRGGEGPSAART